MSQDELDELFGEEIEEETSLKLSVLNSKKQIEEYEEEINDKEEEEFDNSEEISQEPECDEITISPIKKPSNQGQIPYVLKLPGFIACKRGLFEGESTLKNELIETEFCEYGDLLRAKTAIRNRNVSGNFETNSRLNRWSDGTWTLQIGSEHFEILPQVFSTDENNLLCVRHQNKGCLEAVGKLANKLTVRPFMDAQGTHRKYLALAEATGKGMKKVKVRVATTTADPEKEKRGLVKIQQERIKAKRKLDAKRRNLEQKSLDRVGKEGLTARFLEADEDEEYGNEDEDEYDADFIDDGEIEEVPEEDQEEETEDDDIEEDDDEKEKAAADSRSRTSRLIFDDDDDDD